MNKISKTHWSIIALLSSLVSAGIHFYLTTLHLKLKFGIATDSVCNIDSKFNCDAVSVSNYSTLLSIPIATWGFSTHVVLSMIFIITLIGLSENIQRIYRSAFILSLFILTSSVIMGAISTFFLGTYCLFCIALYILSILTFVACWNLNRENKDNLSDDLKSFFTSKKWIAISVFIGIPALSYTVNKSLLNNYGAGEIKLIVNESLYYWNTEKVIPFNPNQGLILQTHKNSPVKMTIVEFADYLCPHCKHAAPTLSAFSQTRPGVQLIFKAFPLDGSCNAAIPQKGDGLRCKLAYFSHCAEKISGAGWSTHKYIFDNQEKWSSSEFEKQLSNAATLLSLNFSDLKICMSSEETHQSILNQAAEGAAGNIKGTPSIFVNGKILNRGQFMPVLDGVYNL